MFPYFPSLIPIPCPCPRSPTFQSFKLFQIIHKVKPLIFATLIPNPCPCPNSELTHLPQFKWFKKVQTNNFCISDHRSLSLSKLTHLSEFSLMLRIFFASTTFRQPWPTIVCSQCQNYQQCKSKLIELRVNLVDPFKISHLTQTAFLCLHLCNFSW